MDVYVRARECCVHFLVQMDVCFVFVCLFTLMLSESMTCCCNDRRSRSRSRVVVEGVVLKCEIGRCDESHSIDRMVWIKIEMKWIEDKRLFSFPFNQSCVHTIIELSISFIIMMYQTLYRYSHLSLSLSLSLSHHHRGAWARRQYTHHHLQNTPNRDKTTKQTTDKKNRQQ
jgi:hypothetical protein